MYRELQRLGVPASAVVDCVEKSDLINRVQQAMQEQKRKDDEKKAAEREDRGKRGAVCVTRSRL